MSRKLNTYLHMDLWKKLGIIAALLVGSSLLIYSVTEPPTENTTKKKIHNEYKIYALPIPEVMDFAGEPVPLDQPDIRERMDRELLVNAYWQSNGLLIFKRANKYFPKIEAILRENNLPEDFKYLAVAESGLQDVVSPAGAAGFWQFMPATAKEYGLEVNSYVDERYHLELVTKAAAQYLHKAKDHFGSWTLAAAAYNAGRNGIGKQIERQKAPRNYYDLLLNPETSRYMFRILAFKEIMANPKGYGFHFNNSDLYHPIPVKKIKVDTSIEDLAEFAKEHGINYKILKIHNPWLRDTKLLNKSGKTYYIEIPEPGFY